MEKPQIFLAHVPRSPYMMGRTEWAELRASMTVGRPELVETIAFASGLHPAHVEAVTRAAMEAGILPKIKGRRTPRRASYTPQDGSAALLSFGLAAKGAIGAAEAYGTFAVLRADAEGWRTAHDPVGLLLPPLEAHTAGDEIDRRLELRAFLAALLGNISRLPADQAIALRQAPGSADACLDLISSPPSALFRWTADGESRQVRFEYPETPLHEVLGKDPPAYQTVTKIYFPLLFAVGRLFAATAKHSSAEPVPSSGEASASAAPEAGNENAAIPARTAAPARKRNRPRHNATGAVNSPETREMGDTPQPYSSRRPVMSMRRTVTYDVACSVRP